MVKKFQFVMGHTIKWNQVLLFICCTSFHQNSDKPTCRGGLKLSSEICLDGLSVVESMGFSMTEKVVETMANIHRNLHGHQLYSISIQLSTQNHLN